MPNSSLTKSEINLLKNNLAVMYCAELKSYGNCGKQLFSVNKMNNEINKYITIFFNARSINIAFTENGLGFFTVRYSKASKNSTE